MDSKSIIRKNEEDDFCFDHQGENLIILLDEDAGNACVLNQVSQFLYENCDNKSVEELVQLLYEQLLDKEQLDYQIIMNDCIDALNEMVSFNLIYIE